MSTGESYLQNNIICISITYFNYIILFYFRLGKLQTNYKSDTPGPATYGIPNYDAIK